ncbi:hypothetical protein PoB_004963000 [Plakobranchus ocellatus]|uniref:Uncharacterized protein n=1 Tax=Plakobranchus ocellatus TaxID=259542 RepID=A0AAV4BRC0_9GAST|nr:hypothetical protein PoB_004963000 [Plakobranchus ocellatus]
MVDVAWQTYSPKLKLVSSEICVFSHPSHILSGNTLILFTKKKEYIHINVGAAATAAADYYDDDDDDDDDDYDDDDDDDDDDDGDDDD